MQVERQRLGMTQKTLAESTGVSKTTQANYETGFRTPDARYLARLAELGGDVLFVVTGQEPVRTPLAPDMVAVPLLQAGAAVTPAGVVAEKPAAFKVPIISLRRDWLAARGLHAEQLRAARVAGHLMQGALNDGDLALVDIADLTPRAGYVYAVQQGPELIFRYCTPLPGGRVRVSAANGAFAQFDVDVMDAVDFQVVGRVVATVHDL